MAGRLRLGRSLALPWPDAYGSAGASPSHGRTLTARQEPRPPMAGRLRLGRSLALPWPRPSMASASLEPTMDDPQKYLDPVALAKVRGLELQARLVVEGYLSGMHKSPYHGFSVEFAQHREYVPGDDLEAPRLEGLQPHRPLLSQAVRGRDEPGLLAAGRCQRVDAVRLRPDQRRGPAW